MDTSKTTSVEKVYAWLIPAKEERHIIAIGTKEKTFGYNSKENDVALKNICAAERQAKIVWDGENLIVSSCNENALTELNGVTVKESEIAYNNEIISLAGEKFKIYRCDNCSRPAEEYIVRFVCDGEIIEEQTCKKEENPIFPAMPTSREEPDGIKIMVRWDERTDLSDKNTVVYEAKYRQYDPNKDTATVSSKNGIFLLNCSTSNIINVPESGIKIGGTKDCDIFIPGLGDCVAKIDRGSGRITAYSSGAVTVNNEAIEYGRSVSIYEKDQIKVADRSYAVIGHKREETPKLQVPVLLKDGKTVIRLEKLTKGKPVTLGRGHDEQEVLNNIGFISHEHATIRCDSGKYFIKDTSKNGTSVIKADSEKEYKLSNGEEMQIEPGDTIKLFMYELVFAIE